MRPVSGSGPAAAVRRDPAPSRLKYRLERLMLTPLVRLGLRVGLPFAISFALGGWWFSVPGNQQAVVQMVAQIRHEFESRPEFQVDLMSVEGASDQVAEDIREILPMDFPMSSFDLDVAHMKEAIDGLDAVRQADIRIDDHILRISVTERIPSVLWRHAGGLELLDGGGVVVGPAASRHDHAHLPVIAGEGAELAVPEVLDLFAVAGPLRARLRGFERISARRWDVVLDRGQRIHLPDRDSLQALERVQAMDAAVDLLARDILAIDLRLPHRPTLRLSGAAKDDFRRFKAIEIGGVQQQ